MRTAAHAPAITTAQTFGPDRDPRPATTRSSRRSSLEGDSWNIGLASTRQERTSDVRFSTDINTKHPRSAFQIDPIRESALPQAGWKPIPYDR